MFSLVAWWASERGTDRLIFFKVSNHTDIPDYVRGSSLGCIPSPCEHILAIRIVFIICLLCDALIFLCFLYLFQIMTCLAMVFDNTLRLSKPEGLRRIPLALHFLWRELTKLSFVRTNVAVFSPWLKWLWNLIVNRWQALNSRLR